MNPEENTRPETPTLDTPVTDTPAETPAEETVVEDVASRLGGNASEEANADTTAPQAQTPRLIDLNALTPEQVQDLQELFANTPRRAKKVEEYHTIELRQINGKVIVEWGKTYFDLKTDPVQRRDVMKTMIPVRFFGETEFHDILWKEDFMSAERVTCRIVNMHKKEVPVVVGRTFKRDNDGGLTSQEVEMYVNKLEITLDILLPDGKTTTINGEFAN